MGTTDQNAIDELLTRAHTVAVLGASNRSGRPANYVPAYLHRSGFKVLPVNPRHVGEESWGEPFVGTLGRLREPVDIVNVFRRSADVALHVDEILSLEPQPHAVWLQLGIRNDEAARRLEAAGITVIQDRCILIDHRSLQ